MFINFISNINNIFFVFRLCSTFERYLASIYMAKTIAHTIILFMQSIYQVRIIFCTFSEFAVSSIPNWNFNLFIIRHGTEEWKKNTKSTKTRPSANNKYIYMWFTQTNTPIPIQLSLQKCSLFRIHCNLQRHTIDYSTFWTRLKPKSE